MKEKIEKRLAELYKQQVNLTDTSRRWVEEENNLRRSELIKFNFILIREIEDILKSESI